jgi:beta-aspartyl-peptidase (threonine type)
MLAQEASAARVEGRSEPGHSGKESMMETFTLAIHGGAGTMRPEAMTPEAEVQYHAGLRDSLKAGHQVLAAGGTALDGVTAAVMALEDNPLFNAGRGAVFTRAGVQEMDAAVMRGQDRAAGTVAGISGPRNPIQAARAVMEQSEHVLLVGQGALDFCRQHGIAFAPPAYFHTPGRWQALQNELARQAAPSPDTRDDAAKHGTVGAVARDRHGNLAAATSTGGMTAKLPGRIGDSPIFGAGTWADNETCAISATGHGEYFIRWAAAHEISARMRHRGEALEAAAATVVDELGKLGGSGGLIAIDATGRVSLPFNCQGMYRGIIGTDGIARTGIYRDPLREG